VLFYNVRIALLSLRRNRGLSAVIVGGIALGVGVSTVFSAARHAFARDPIPHKSDVLHYVRLDSWDPASRIPRRRRRAPTQITYRDMVEIEVGHPARRAGCSGPLYVFPILLQPGRPGAALLLGLLPMFGCPSATAPGGTGSRRGPERWWC
jgi:hypothetical protein